MVFRQTIFGYKDAKFLTQCNKFGSTSNICRDDRLPPRLGAEKIDRPSAIAARYLMWVGADVQRLRYTVKFYSMDLVNDVWTTKRDPRKTIALGRSKLLSFSPFVRRIECTCEEEILYFVWNLSQILMFWGRQIFFIGRSPQISDPIS